MKLLLLRVLLQRRARDEGFTLPMVIALGLVMILLGTTSIVKSSEENLNAIIQNSSSDALAVAEVGITKYRELLNQNRVLTIYNDDQWNTNAAIVGADTAITDDDRTCYDMTSAPADSAGNPIWTGTATKPNDTAATATDAAGADNDNWWEIREDLNGDGDTADDEDLVGEYRLVSYIYDNDGNPAVQDNGEFAPNNDEADTTDSFAYNDTIYDPSTSTVPSGYNPRGLLTVQGRSPDGSRAQIEVEIPLRINNLTSVAPVLWIDSTETTYTDSFAGNVGTVTIPDNANIVRFVAGCGDPADIGTNSVVNDSRGLPPITSIATKVTEAETAGSINTPALIPANLGATNDNPYVTPTGVDPFDASSDCSNITDCRYYYKLPAGTQTIGTPTETDGIAKVTLYVDGDLTINEDILGSAVASNYLEIYVNGARNITINSDSVNTVKAFIHAPNSTLTVNGTGTVNIVGSVWVDKFINNATVNFGVRKVDPVTGVITYETETTKVSSRASAPTYTLYTTTNNRTPRPLTSSPTNWVREEVE